MPRAFTFPGVLHISHNILADLSSHLEHWTQFYQQLQQFKWLWQDGRKERFIRFCVEPLLGQAPAELEKENGLQSLYTARFGEVTMFCQRLLPLLPLLKRTWSADRFRAGPMELLGKWSMAVAANEFDPDLFTSILKDQLFEDYLAMVIQLHEATKRLSQAAEECPCHEQESRCEDHKRRRAVLGRQHMRCPMRGRVLPELVVDGWASLLVPYDLPGHNVEQGMLLAAGCSEGKVHK